MRNSPLVKTTRFRRAVWKTKDEALEHFKKKEKFAKFDEDVLRDYIEYGTVKTEKGFELLFNPQIEAKIYGTLPHYLPKLRGKLTVPAFYIGGTQFTRSGNGAIGFYAKKFSDNFNL